MPFLMNERVGFRTHFDESGWSYPGTIRRVWGDGTYFVLYDTGDKTDHEEERDLVKLVPRPKEGPADVPASSSGVSRARRFG